MKKLNVSLVFLTLLFSMIISFPVEYAATGDVTLVNWDEGPVTATSGTFGKFTLENTIRTDVDIDNSYTYSDFFQLRHHTTDEVPGGVNEAYLNLTQNYEYISEITLYTRFNFKAEVGSYSRHFHNYIYFANDSGNFFYIRVYGYHKWNPQAGAFKLYIDGDGAEQELLDIEEYHPTIDNWHTDTDIQYKIVISHVTSNLMNVSIYNLTGEYLNGLQVATLQAYDWESFSQIKLVGENDIVYAYGDYLDTFIDDIIISTTGTTADEEGTQEKPVGYETDEPTCGILGYTPITEKSFQVFNLFGIIPIWYADAPIPYLDVEYPYYVDRTIKYVDLYVVGDQYNLVSSDLNSYSLYINGINCGYADAWISTGGGNYLLRWTGAVDLTDEKPLFEFKSTESFVDANYGEYYWYPAIMVGDCGLKTGLYHNINLWGNNEFNGILFKYITGGVEYPASVYMKYSYYEDAPLPSYDESTYKDTITTDKSIYYSNQEPIYIDGTVDDTGASVHIYNTDTDIEIIDYGFPQTVYTSDFHYVLHLNALGNYNATVERGGVITNDTYFEVLTTESNYSIHTFPCPSTIEQTVRINYTFNDPDGYDGRIVVSTTPYYNSSDVLDFWLISSSASEKHIYYGAFSTEGSYYFLMLRYNTVSGGYQFVSSWPHTVETEGYKTNIITFKYNPLILANTHTQTIYYEHSHMGSNNIWLKVDSNYVKCLKGSSSGEYNYNVITAKVYNVSIVLKDIENGDTVLTWKLFTASEYDPADYGGGKPPSILPDVDATLGYILGLLLTMFCLLAPLIVTKGLQSNASLPPLVYVFSGGIGLAVSTAIGWFPAWIIAFISIIGIIVTIILYIKGGSNGGA